MLLSSTLTAAALNTLPADDLLALRAKSLRTIECLLDDPQTSPTVRLRAALAILAETRAIAKAAPTPAPESVAETAAHPAPGIMKGSQRNQPCPCGSGIKYKKCCGSASVADTATAAASLIGPAIAKLAAFRSRSNSAAGSQPTQVQINSLV